MAPTEAPPRPRLFGGKGRNDFGATKAGGTDAGKAVLVPPSSLCCANGTEAATEVVISCLVELNSLAE